MLKFRPFVFIVPILVILVSCINAQIVPGIPQFLESPQEFRCSRNTWGVAQSDLDGDRDRDIVLAAISAPSRIMLNNGKARFTLSDQVLPDEMHGVAIGDIDGDGDQDLFFAPNQNQRRPVFLNDGRGKFVQTALVVDVCGSVELIDMENDGDLDAYLGLGSELLVNNGEGEFTRRNLPIPRFSVPGHLNGDDFVDYVGVVGEHKSRRFVAYLNSGKGEFRESSAIPTDYYQYSDFTFADLDNDGDSDILYKNASDNDEGHSGILINDGTGQLSGGRSDLPPATAVGKITTADLNGDGFLDFVITNWFKSAQVWLNDGRGGFNDSGLRLGAGKGWVNCLVADLDNDTDPDVLMVNRLTGDLGLWLNQASEKDGK